MALATNYNNTTFSSGELVTHDKLNTVKVVQTGDTSANNIIGNAGQLTFDTTTKQLRVHDGSTAGGHILGGQGGAVIADDAVTDTKLADNAVITAKIKDSTGASDGVTFAKIQFLANLKVIGNVSGSLAVPTEITINDTDSMSDASATTLATSESIKAYVDSVGNNVFAKGFIDTSGNVTRGTNIASATYATVGSLAYQLFTINLTSGPASDHGSYNVQIGLRCSSEGNDTAGLVTYRWVSSTQIKVSVNGVNDASQPVDGISFLIIE